MTKKKNPLLVRLGKQGAKARMEQLTQEQRTAVAKIAATARWAKTKPTKGKG